MINILVYCSNETAKQNHLETYYNSSFDPDTEADPKSLVSFDEESGEYDFIVIAAYPNIYKRNGIQSVINYKCSQAIKDLIDDLPPVVDVLAIDDNNPDSEYLWEGNGNASINKFTSVVGNDWFTGSGTPGDEDYIAPRNKLCVLA